jgi:hypothetical protein
VKDKEVNKLEVVHTELDLLEKEVRRQPTPVPAVDLDKLTSEAVLASFEATVEAWKQTEEDIKARIASLGASLGELHRDLTLVRECMAVIREKGRMSAAQVDEANALSADFRKMAAEFSKKAGK